MALKLSEKQRLFTKYVGELIRWCYANGYELTFGEALRTPEMQAIYLTRGLTTVKTSKHQLKLAIDLNLFIAGVYQDKSEAYAPLGKFWKSLDKNNIWGGDWKSLKDGNHFEYGG